MSDVGSDEEDLINLSTLPPLVFSDESPDRDQAVRGAEPIGVAAVPPTASNPPAPAPAPAAPVAPPPMHPVGQPTPQATYESGLEDSTHINRISLSVNHFSSLTSPSLAKPSIRLKDPAAAKVHKLGWQPQSWKLLASLYNQHPFEDELAPEILDAFPFVSSRDLRRRLQTLKLWNQRRRLGAEVRGPRGGFRDGSLRGRTSRSVPRPIHRRSTSRLPQLADPPAAHTPAGAPHLPRHPGSSPLQ